MTRHLAPLLVAAMWTAAAGADDFFETRIRPVLIEHCYECHSAGAAELQGGLRLDYREGIRRGGESGPAVVPGRPEASPLLLAIRSEEMPPDSPLPARVVADFQRWIRDGAADPRDRPPSAEQAAEQTWQRQLAARRGWWSLQRPHASAPPEVKGEWSREPIDRFVRARLDARGLRPARPADGETLLRRMALVLTGLPPDPELAGKFPADYRRDPQRAVAALADRLLQSPHFGERTARHWMDVVRYTDTYGYEWDNPAKGSWEYRDYLIRAFNADVPFDRLLREHLAGDLLPEPRIDGRRHVNESLIGPMFFHLGEHRHGASLDFNGIHQEMINNKIDAFSKAFLATTVACARCHDHKLDAVSQRDYYALAGVFMTPRWTTRVIDTPQRHHRQIAELKQLRGEIRRTLAADWERASRQLGPALRTWAETAASGSKADAAAPAIEDIAWPLRTLAAADDSTIDSAWKAMRERWNAERTTRSQSNDAKFTVLADFQRPELPPGWTAEGDGMTHGHVADGSALIALDGDRVVETLLLRGFHTHALSSKLPGAVRLPPQHLLGGQRVSLRLRGGEWAGHLTAPENAFQSEAVSFLHADAPAAWISLADKPLSNGVTRVFVDVLTASLNPNFPPRTGLARAGAVKLPDDDLGYDKRSWFSLTGVVAHDDAGQPADTLEHLDGLFGGEPPQTVDQGWARIERWFGQSVRTWAEGRPSDADVRKLNWLLSQGLLPNTIEAISPAGPLVERYREVESQIDFARTVNSMDERNVAPLDYRLNIRGDVHRDGAAVPRGFLEAFPGGQAVGDSEGSGRLELANYLASGEHPQTARVYVNRVWQWVFGTGLVATSSDFGRLGELPSHPELLDHLATRFVERGWSTKRLVRQLVLSETFRQSGEVDAAALERDPDNRLLHHYPLRRLEAEAIRDSLLAVSGRLDARLYGPPIDPPRLVEDSAKRLFSGPLDSRGRRSLYIKMSIMDPPKFLVCFNLPDLKLPTGRRDVTNVPAQALAMLNDPLVVELADHWGGQLVRDGRSDPKERVRAMFRRALAREPTPDELRRWTAAVEDFAGDGSLMEDRRAWAQLAHAMMNTKEFIYYR